MQCHAKSLFHQIWPWLRAQESGKTGGCFGHFGRRGQHFPCHSGSPHESASASTSPACVRAHSNLQVVFREKTQTGRVCPSNNCEGTGEFGRGCCGAGEAGSIVGGWRAEVESASSRGEEQSFFFHYSPPPVDAFKGVGQVAASSTNGSHDLRRRVNGIGPPPPPRVAAGTGTGTRLQAAVPGCKPGTG